MPSVVAHGGGRFKNIADFAILAAHLIFKVRYRAVLLEETPQALAVGAIHEKLGRNIQSQQIVARIVASHAEQRVVEVQKAPARSGDKNSFLHGGDQECGIFLRRACAQSCP